MLADTELLEILVDLEEIFPASIGSLGRCEIPDEPFLTAMALQHCGGYLRERASDFRNPIEATFHKVLHGSEHIS